MPQLLVNFYGYTDLEFIKEPRKLLKQAISAKEIAAIDQTKPVWDDPFLSRYLLYHYSIQQALLPHFYGLPENGDWSAYALSDETLKTFPPCFSTASSSDEEVPFRYSKKIGRTIPESTFKAVYYLEHDFLKQTKDPSVIALFEQLDSWLKER